MRTAISPKPGLSQIFPGVIYDLYDQRFNGSWYNADGTELTVNSDAVVNAMKWEQQFYCDGIKPQQLLDFVATGGDYMAAEQLFYAGKTAFQVDGEWQVGPNFIPAIAPSLNYGITAFPVDTSNPIKKVQVSFRVLLR